MRANRYANLHTERIINAFLLSRKGEATQPFPCSDALTKVERVWYSWKND